MTQAELDREVARTTGESVSAIRRFGFSPLVIDPVELDPEDKIVDWDAVELERNVAMFDQPHYQPRRQMAA